LHTKVEEYRFCAPLQRITNLYNFTEDYKFVHLHRGLQICTPLQRITNLCALMFTHTFIDRCTLDHCHGVPLQPLLRTSQTSKLATLLQWIVIPIQENCTQVFDKDIEITWMEGTYTTSWKPWKIRDPQNHRKTIQWTDHVPKDSIILFDFALTSTNHLRKATVQHLKKNIC